MTGAKIDMSFDIFVQDIPVDAKDLAGIPDDFVPKPIASRSTIVQAIHKIAPHVVFAQPAWGSIDGEDHSIEFDLGVEDPVLSFAFHLRGGDGGLVIVAAILSELGLRAFVPGIESGIFDPAEVDQARRAFSRWRAYRDHVVR